MPNEPVYKQCLVQPVYKHCLMKPVYKPLNWFLHMSLVNLLKKLKSEANWI